MADPVGHDDPALTYGAYLALDEVLGAQRPRSDEHDELLFIVVHQVYELWFKQLLHELDSVIPCLDGDDVLGAHRLLRRCIEIERVLIEQVTVLETMTPNDFLTFRDQLMPASGFQSAQFRALEFVCGLKDARQLDHHAPGSRARTELEHRLSGRTIGEAFEALIERRAPAPEGSAESPSSAPRLVRQLLGIYQEPGAHYDLYLLAEALIEFDEAMRNFRSIHIHMVLRVIGGKEGTGGSSGAGYLRKTLDYSFFPLLWRARDQMEAP